MDNVHIGGTHVRGHTVNVDWATLVFSWFHIFAVENLALLSSEQWWRCAVIRWSIWWNVSVWPQYIGGVALLWILTELRLVGRPLLTLLQLSHSLFVSSPQSDAYHTAILMMLMLMLINIVILMLRVYQQANKISYLTNSVCIYNVYPTPRIHDFSSPSSSVTEKVPVLWC